MHYRTLSGDQQAVGLIEDTVIVWLTLAASLMAPIIEHVREPEAGNDGWPDAKWLEQQVNRLVSLLFSESALLLQNHFNAMPLSLRRQAVWSSLFYAFSPHKSDLIVELRAGNAHAATTLLSHYLRFLHNSLELRLDFNNFDDFVQLSRGLYRLKLFEKTSENWVWYEFRLGQVTKWGTSAPAELCIASKGTKLTLKSLRAPDWGDVLTTQRIWQ